MDKEHSEDEIAVKAEAFATELFKKHGVRLCDMQLDWSNRDVMGQKREHYITHVTIKISADFQEGR